MVDDAAVKSLALNAVTPASGLLPVSFGTATLEEVTPGRITSFAP